MAIGKGFFFVADDTIYSKSLCHWLSVDDFTKEATLQEAVARLSIIVLGNKVRKMGWTLLGKDIQPLLNRLKIEPMLATVIIPNI